VQKTSKFAFDVGWVLVSSLVSLAIAFLLRIVLARWLGAADLGLYTMVITIREIAIFVAGLGIPSALVKHVAQYKDDEDRLSQIISAAFISSIIFGLVIGVLLFALSGILAGVFHMPELNRLLMILAFMFPFTSILQALLGLFNGLRRMKTYAYLMVLRSFLMVLSIVVLVWLGFGVEGAVWGIVLSVIGGCVFGLYFSRKLLHLNLRGFSQGAKRLVSFGSQVFAAGALGVILGHTDIMMIGYFLAAKDVGYYGIAVSLSSLFLIIPQAIQSITYPATSQYWSQNNHPALRRMIDKSMKYSACILLPVGLAVGFFAQEVVMIIFGQEFIYAAGPLWVLLIARVIRGGTIVPIGASFSGIGRPDLTLKLSAVSAGANVGLNILLIPPLGIVGAAIATTISLFLGTVIFLVLMPRILGVRIDIKWYTQAMGSAGIAIALFLVGTRLINPYVVGGVILCGYVILAFKVFLTKDDRAMFGSLAYSLVRRR